MPVILFLDVSGGELLVILLFVLLFFGSKGVPEVARTMGRALRQFRDASAEVQREIEKGARDVKQGYEQQRKAFRIEPPDQAVPRHGGTPVSPLAPDGGPGPLAPSPGTGDSAPAEQPGPPPAP
ncbi:MAG: twin-arginine translocase TatA/TatE family subunit [Flavobacteriales bacterium]|nr:twin-arginine translocase TatA/TatE family subunit [Flavobacteriales bacterium]MBP9079803.1 twin-arginine translocase TatA/TatE family subunit [Flavobacteriales bacterium]